MTRKTKRYRRKLKRNRKTVKRYKKSFNGGSLPEDYNPNFDRSYPDYK
jgi:hypothetical protein